MNWDDLRFVLALIEAGSLVRAAKVLGVEHTTVGRRVEAAETALGVRLFTRTTTGYLPTDDAERLVTAMRGVEEAVLAVERSATAKHAGLDGTVRVTSAESLGIAYLAPRLAAFGRRHPNLTIEVVASGEVLDLARRQAEIAVRPFRTKHENLVVRRVGELFYGLYASREYLARNPIKSPRDLDRHPLLTGHAGPGDVDAVWLRRIAPNAHIAFSSELSLALVGAARASAGVAVLPRYLGDADPSLQHLPMPAEPSTPLWLTVHRDLKQTPRVRAVLDFLAQTLKDDAALLRGARGA
jgi:DNA-binding transcriptional LysR family regulator